jgi:hypothetical protein
MAIHKYVNDIQNIVKINCMAQWTIDLVGSYQVIVERNALSKQSCGAASLFMGLRLRAKF